MTKPELSVVSNGLPIASGLTLISFGVEGEPKADPRARHSGHVYRDTRADPWKHAVRAQCKLALMRGDVQGLIPLGVAVAVTMTFLFTRPKSHYRGGKRSNELRPTAPVFHTAKPDADNLSKAVLDAVGDFDHLPHLVWCDDQQVAYAPPLKLYADPGQTPGASITIYRLERETPMQHLLHLGDLTSGETLELDRRRAGLSLAAAAGLCGVSAGRLRRQELDAEPATRVNLRRLETYEECYVVRRRLGLSTKQLTERTGLSAAWINKAERGTVRNTDVLLEWWTRQTEFQVPIPRG